MNGHNCLITCLSVNTGPFANGGNNYTYLYKEMPEFYKYFILCNKKTIFYTFENRVLLYIHIVLTDFLKPHVFDVEVTIWWDEVWHPDSAIQKFLVRQTVLNHLCGDHIIFTTVFNVFILQ